MSKKLRTIALQRATPSDLFIQRLASAVKWRLRSMKRIELLLLPFDGALVVPKGIDERCCPLPTDIHVVRSPDHVPMSVVCPSFEMLAGFRHCLNDLRTAKEPIEEELAEDSRHLARYVSLSTDEMAEFLFRYATHQLNDFPKLLALGLRAPTRQV